MRFSTRTRYGLRFLLWLAKKPRDRLFQLGRIAEEESISRGYLEQIVHVLKPLGILRCTRGVGGGYALAKEPSAIGLEAVIDQLEGNLSPVSCLAKDESCVRQDICSTRTFWQQFEAYVRQYLRSQSVQSLLDAQGGCAREESMWEYTQQVQDHFLKPHNAGPMADANGIGEVGSLACGDALRLYLKISKDGIIEKASFETFGCASAIASSSVLTDMVVGMHVDDALKLTNKDIVARLGGLPKEKMHCSVMGQEALEAAVRNWRGEPPIPHAQEIGKLVCKCFGVTDAQIIRTIRENNLTTVEEVTNYTKAGGGCGSCLDEIAEILAAELHKKTEPKVQTVGKPILTNVQRMNKLLHCLEKDVKPGLQEGEDVELVDVEGVRITLALTSKEPKELLTRITPLLQKAVHEDLVVVEA